MRKVIGFIGLSFLGMLSSGAFALDLARPLPNWVDKTREHADGRPPAAISRAAQQPPSDFRLPAEYEKVAAVVIGWAGYTDMLTSIAQAVTGPGRAQIWGVSAPASISGVPAGSYSRINVPIDTVWMRDYGPYGISSGQTRVGIVDSTYRHYQYRRNDDALPSNLGKAKKMDIFGMPLIIDGGNVMTDSKGDLFMTKRTYVWNSNMSPEQVDAALKNYFKVKNIYTFDYSGYPAEPADGTGHIDMFMKLLNDHTVLISVADTEPFKSTGEKAAAFFKGKTAPDGVPYKVITVKGWDSSGTWYTYTNSLIVNGVVLMPSYSGHDTENAQGKAAYEAGIPGVNVVSINSDDSITSGGSIHCVTQTIPVLPPAVKDMTFTDMPEFDAVSMTLEPANYVTLPPVSAAFNQLKEQAK
ncbi:MAG: agmatine deiminase family protein [Elusimicrobia bacterium]|nr:agmatine deiminase family protein [Elusimicrobiota bacterium]